MMTSWGPLSRGRANVKKTTRDYRATVPGIKRFGEQISRPAVTAEMRVQFTGAQTSESALASRDEELFQKLHSPPAARMATRSEGAIARAGSGSPSGPVRSSGA